MFSLSQLDSNRVGWEVTGQFDIAEIAIFIVVVMFMLLLILDAYVSQSPNRTFYSIVAFALIMNIYLIWVSTRITPYNIKPLDSRLSRSLKNSEDPETLPSGLPDGHTALKIPPGLPKLKGVAQPKAKVQAGVELKSQRKGETQNIRKPTTVKPSPKRAGPNNPKVQGKGPKATRPKRRPRAQGKPLVNPKASQRPPQVKQKPQKPPQVKQNPQKPPQVNQKPQNPPQMKQKPKTPPQVKQKPLGNPQAKPQPGKVAAQATNIKAQVQLQQRQQQRQQQQQQKPMAVKTQKKAPPGPKNLAQQRPIKQGGKAIPNQARPPQSPGKGKVPPPRTQPPRPPAKQVKIPQNPQ